MTLTPLQTRLAAIFPEINEMDARVETIVVTAAMLGSHLRKRAVVAAVTVIVRHDPVIHWRDACDRFEQRLMDALAHGRHFIVFEETTAIMCLICGFTSYNQSDVEFHYCGFCHAHLLDEYAVADARLNLPRRFEGKGIDPNV